MEVNKETESKIAQLQMLEQNIQNFLMQKQTFQTQLIEVDNALEELDKTTGNTYKIVGGIMIATDKETLNMELQGRKEVLGLRIKNIEKQENQLKEKASNLQSEVLKQIKNKEDN
ncbi:prefoldin subunit beta [Candidatus Woesearchaeota archaeon]|nr:prefoldin subunit beta [Candidatus Woesearchaeota archaeon]